MSSVKTIIKVVASDNQRLRQKEIAAIFTIRSLVIIKFANPSVLFILVIYNIS